MKKKLIIGVASLALATAPVVSAFAATTASDTVQVTVSIACDITGGGTKTGTASTSSVISITGSTFHGNCNAPKGYTIALSSATDLTNSSSSTYKIPYTSSAPTAGTAGWTVYNGSNIMTTAGANPIASTSASDRGTGTDATAPTYKVAITNTQAAGTYSGTATFTIAAKTY